MLLLAKKCAHCEEVIKGQYVEAMDVTWCPDHFVCATCSQPFADDTFYKHDNHPYCETHYRQLTSEDCAMCGEQILDGEMMEGADEKKYHMKCFVCDVDKAQIGDGDQYHLSEGKLYCDAHLRSKFISNCAICKKSITAEYCVVGGDKMHKSCYKGGESGSSSGPGKSSGSGGGSSPAPSASSSAPSASSSAPSASSSSKSSPAPSSSKSGGTATTSTATTTVTTGTEEKKEEKKAGGDDEITTFFAYASLTDPNNLPDGVKHINAREQYLEDSEFEKLFGCDKTAFKKLPQWKKKAKKIKLRLW